MQQPNPAYIRDLIGKVNTSAFPTHMAMRLIDISYDEATLALDLGVCHLQPFGIVHGGVLATLIDTATFWAVFLRLPEDAGLVNIDLKLNYLQPVQRGRLRACGRAIRSGNSISYAEARVQDEEGRLLAHGTSTLMVLPGKGLKMEQRKFLAG
ncbi:MAG: thioesterase superfamily protein [uncultured bacterium]|nr:MAG: thioesterase superfamily protein [uncultured bacterium]HBG18541.1 PaaI family thioesterase [Desulfobulbaceae bacterium]